MEAYKEAINRFQALFAKALQSDMKEPTAMTLSTVGPDGKPSSRLVLLKDVDEKGFVFYTNAKSRKGQQIENNPNVALCFYWPSLDSQVRIEGVASPVSKEEADKYWATRPRESQIGAWASQQSEPLDKRETLLARFSDYQKNFGNDVIPKPPFWSGYRVEPNRMEFWKAKDHRLHERVVYEKIENAWTSKGLYP